MSEDPDADDERFDAAHRRARAHEAAAKAIPARSLADIRHKVLTLWPIDARDNVTDDDFAETLRCLREDVEQLGVAEIFGDAALPLPTLPEEASPDLALACSWLVEHRAWIDEAAKAPEWTDDRLFGEIQKDNAVISRAIATPASTGRELWAKAWAALDEFDRFVMNDDAGVDDGARLVQSALRDVVRLCDPAREAPKTAAATLVDRMLAGWRQWSEQSDDLHPEGSEEEAAYQRVDEQRWGLIDEAVALPATLNNLAPKSLAAAWALYVVEWRNGQARDEYGDTGRLVLDVDTAICGRLKTDYASHA